MANSDKKKKMSDTKMSVWKAARDLGYGQEVMDKIKNAKSETEMSIIMSQARQKYWKQRGTDES